MYRLAVVKTRKNTKIHRFLVFLFKKLLLFNKLDLISTTKYKFLPFIIVIFTLTIFSCKHGTVIQNNSFVADNKYDSEFPNKSLSPKLESISKSVKKLDVMVFYSTYYFPEEDSITKSNINDSLLRTYRKSNTINHESVAGTASIIYRNNNIVGLLTCAHTVEFKDIKHTYYDDNRHILHSYSVKLKQQCHVSGLSNNENPEIIVFDKQKDIAILKVEIEPHTTAEVLNIPVGTANDLQWGSVVYTIGYPLGILMATRSIVSINNKIQSGVFVTDALYNHGISGSPVMAIRDGIPNMELIGMASASAAQNSLLLSPDKKYKNDYYTEEKYNGAIFVDNTRLINYGVSYSTTIDEIITFIKSKKRLLEQNGFTSDMFFK